MAKKLYLTFRLCLLLSLSSSVGAAGGFTFIQLSDPQFGFITANNDFSAEEALYSKAIDYINRTCPAFVVVTGDFVNNRTDTVQINAFRRITALISKSIPVYLIPGNHDMGQDPTPKHIEFYFRHYPSDHFAFTYQNVLFVGLNSCYIKSSAAQESLQMDWLKRTLSTSNAKRTIIFTHHPFFLREFDEIENYTNINVDKRKEYFQLFSRSHVKTIFAGHYHSNAIASFQGIEMVTTSAVGKQLGQDQPGFREITVLPCSIIHRYVEIGSINALP